MRSIWLEADGAGVGIIDQCALPLHYRTAVLRSAADAAEAIEQMRVRGAPLIGATAAYGLALAARCDASDAALEAAAALLLATRPTAVNLRWAIARMMRVLRNTPGRERADVAYRTAAHICDEDVQSNRRIGEHGVKLLQELAHRNPGRPVQVLTHCNAGWLATVDWGTATAPVYQAVRAGIRVHVWVDETRPRVQGALTAWELAEEGVAHTIIADNTGGHLMQRGMVDIVITGTDRVAASGDVANKIGTYLKALAAHDTGVPFYVAAPTSSIDFGLRSGTDIPIEERSPRELTHVRGLASDDATVEVAIHPAGSPALNIGFDVTPARLVSGLITEHGIVAAEPAALARLASTANAGVAS